MLEAKTIQSKFTCHENLKSNVHLAYTLVIALISATAELLSLQCRLRFTSNLHVTLNRYVIITHQTTKWFFVLFVNGETFCSRAILSSSSQRCIRCDRCCRCSSNIHDDTMGKCWKRNENLCKTELYRHSPKNMEILFRYNIQKMGHAFCAWRTSVTTLATSVVVVFFLALCIGPYVRYPNACTWNIKCRARVQNTPYL